MLNRRQAMIYTGLSIFFTRSEVLKYVFLYWQKFDPFGWRELFLALALKARWWLSTDPKTDNLRGLGFPGTTKTEVADIEIIQLWPRWF